jgi:hypothetical protein
MRRSFTVEIKQGATSGRTFIPTRSPQSEDKSRRVASPAAELLSVFGSKVVSPSSDAKVDEPRRILPSLIAWKPSEPESEPEAQLEPQLPRVRRVATAETNGGVPRRKGRPRKAEATVEPAISDQSVSIASCSEVSVLSSAIPVALVRSHRSARPDVTGLRRAERWKRRLPRACW